MRTPIDQRAILNRVQQSTQQITNKQGVNGSQGLHSGVNGAGRSGISNPVGKSFEAVLQDVTAKQVTVSKHAKERLALRSVTLSDSDLERVSQAMDLAAKKGIKDAVILLNDNVLIASVSNKTIITASKKEDLEDQIITNINGAIII